MPDVSKQAEERQLTYKRYEQLRRELDDLNHKKSDLDVQLARLEREIYNFEGDYLANTIHHGGNLIRGFDNFLKNASNLDKKKKLPVLASDRLFSMSSSTYEKALQIKVESPANCYKTLKNKSRQKKRKAIDWPAGIAKRTRSSKSEGELD
ncbi:3373_t:CDS:1 [Paraglomus occultum]|uniref:Chromatin modification-related protein EAF6 n=1 Tax=Paraglomus occultum TaxID=144539 RepID=A0A9N9CW28_9GLOM|nr:3373_t:CDS:1 [Paraglomus occultum]